MISRLVDDKSRAAIAASIERRRVDARGLLFKVVLQSCLLITLALLAVLLVTVALDSTDQLGTRLWDFLQGTLRSRSSDESLGIHQGMYGSLWIAIIVAVLAFPIGIGAAVYLEEYAPRNRLTAFIEVNIRNLAGVPSVVYGLLGLALLLNGQIFGLDRLTGGSSALSGGITLAILVLPIVIITSGEAFRAVPMELREGAYGVGATRWEMIRTQVLPYAAPGILTGTLLSMARAIGEAAPLILVGAVTGRLGDSPGLFDVGALDDRFTALPIIITSWTAQSGRDVGFAAAAAAAIVVLLVFVLMMNSAAILLRNRFEKKRG
ncbi:MAG: phosphate ABC transporter permease PstA [Acidimicrobiaceae bacterium]|nr:phosphate ABC transporter permease PstA [Acidimicrobiaceae bacterium]MXZ97750.1 phosphate ABC transporter permease PstA [Acidimicrobiaceae bacterium]MYE74964.1 phosphate ABC transporter permease PstA [Acidimicrobiaceae bacterium]MYE96457.1 phosphate ABC transporter permease PstA [Acidimicrobiaceae bacterium]MYH42217.1 phosphate ABC transporter permease PstA [Acidimicrobiaceae bacterium]